MATNDLPDCKPVGMTRLPPAKQPTPAPAWVALLSAWMGIGSVVAVAVLPFLPGSRRPREELERHAFTLADRYIPFPIYFTVVSLFIGIVVLWQMRRTPRPLPDALVIQRVQAWVGLVLTLAAIVFLYVWVGFAIALRAAGRPL